MNRYRYGMYDDGPDPLAEPYDAARAVDELGDRVLDGSSTREALRELMARGTDGLRGLDDLQRKVQQRRKSLERSGRMDGMLERARELLDQAVEAERQALFPDPSDDARFREAQLDALPNQTALLHLAHEVVEAADPVGPALHQVAQGVAHPGPVEDTLAELVDRAARVVRRRQRIGPVVVRAVAVAVHTCPPRLAS